MKTFPSISSLLPPALSFLVLAPAQPAQGLLDGVNAPSFTDLQALELSSVQFDEENGITSVRGNTYKMFFDANGATYIPELGPSAPRNFPVRFRLERAASGSHALDFVPATVARHGDRVTIDRGAIRSEYVAGLNSVEQLFVVDERDAISGALELELSIETELIARHDGNGLAYEGAHGGVRIGAAIVLDASGRRLEIPYGWNAASISLVVPDSFLKGATYPVAVDPLISTTTISADARDESVPDVVWDPVAQRYLVVWEQAFSASDRDIASVFATASGAQNSTFEYIDFSTQDDRAPSVAAIVAVREACVAYTRMPPGSSRDIYTRQRHLDTGDLDARVAVGTSAFDEASPDIGGTASQVSADQRFTIVYQRRESSTTRSIQMRQTLPDSTLLGIIAELEHVAGASATLPKISSSIPPGEQQHNVVWQRTFGSSHSIRVNQVEAHGFTFGPARTLQQSSGILRNPSVSSLGPDIPGESDPGYVVAWENVGPNETDVFLALCSGTSAVALRRQEGMTNVLPDEHQSQPTVACSGDGFALAYAGAPNGTVNHDIFLCGFSTSSGDLAIAERRVLAGVNAGHDRVPRLVSHYESGNASPGFGPFALVWQMNDASGGQSASGDIALSVYGSEQVCGVQVTTCVPASNGTGKGGFLSITGSSSNLASRTIRAVDVPAQSAGLFLASQSFGSGVVPMNSSGVLCLTGSIGRLLPVVISGTDGTAEAALDPTAIAQPNGSVSAMVGQSWTFQYWHRDLLFGAPSSGFTNAATISFD